MKSPGSGIGLPPKDEGDGKFTNADLYKNPNFEQQSINKIYHVVEEWYRTVMSDAPTQWVGYNSGLGFEVSTSVFGVVEPSLQKILSLLHNEIAVKKIGLEESKQKIQSVIDALSKFDYQKDVVESSRQDFIESKASDYITKVKNALEQALLETA